MSEQKLNDDLKERARRVRLLLMDCDGVLTDGLLYYSERGEALKVFNVRDGQGIVNWHNAGFFSGIITGRKSTIVKVRSDELGIKYVRVGSDDKVRDFLEIIAEGGFNSDEVGYIGDDLSDIGLLEQVGLAVAVGDAARELFPRVHYVSTAKGGFGAVREVIDLMLASRSL